MDYCIVSAGIGSRFFPFSNYANKALAPLPSKPIVSLLIDSIPRESRIHVVTGYLGKDLEYIIASMHEDRNLIFYENKDYLSTGMGDSLLPVLERIKSPLIVLPNDGLYNKDSFSKVEFGDSDLIIGVSDSHAKKEDYCQVDVSDSLEVIGISRKGFESESEIEGEYIFTGFLYIRDPVKYKEFIVNSTYSKREIYYPIRDYIDSNHKVVAHKFNWKDCGTYKKYKKILNTLVDYDFSKENETLLIYKNKSIFKIFNDRSISQKRVKKSQLYPNSYPTCKEIPSRTGYSYKFAEGVTLYEDSQSKNLISLLNFLNRELWSKRVSYPDLYRSAWKFYKDKTEGRIEKLSKLYNVKLIKSINNVLIKGSILPTFDYEKLVKNSIFCPIHGDLQYDNVIYSRDSSKFTLIDWRHEFGESVEYGDLYYDLAKLTGGIFLNYKRIKKNDFSCILSLDKKDISYSYEYDDYVSEHITIIKEFHKENSLDFNHTIKLLSLIYLNMSPLHEAPFDLMLLALAYEYNHLNE